VDKKRLSWFQCLVRLREADRDCKVGVFDLVLVGNQILKTV